LAFGPAGDITMGWDLFRRTQAILGLEQVITRFLDYIYYFLHFIRFNEKPFAAFATQSTKIINQIGEFEARPIKWSDFKGEVDEDMPWSAHIYWWIDYKITD
jgi:hypothetical protein